MIIAVIRWPTPEYSRGGTNCSHYNHVKLAGPRFLLKLNHFFQFPLSSGSKCAQLRNCATAQLHNCTMCTAHASAVLMWSHFAGSSDGNSTQHCDILTGELSGQRMCSSRRFFWRISQVAAVGFRREVVGAKNMKSLTIMRGFHQWQWQACQWPQASGNCGFCGR